jgi:hypothetical protein
MMIVAFNESRCLSQPIPPTLTFLPLALTFYHFCSSFSPSSFSSFYDFSDENDIENETRDMAAHSAGILDCRF